jgi:hypothetical protein
MLRSAMRHQPFVNCTRCEFAVLDSHYRRSGAASANAVSSSIDTGQTCLEVFADLEEALLGFKFEQGSEGRFFLSCSFDDLIRSETEF